MIGYTPFLIANTRVGFERDLEPWLLPNDGYPQLEDCYLWRGRIKKKQGYRLLGRLNRKIGTTDGSGNITVTLPNAPLSLGVSQFVIGTDIFQDPQVTVGDPVTLLTNGAATVHTLNRTTGVLTIQGSVAATNVFYYPGLPVMGLRTLDLPTVNTELLLGFDTRYSYLFNTTTGVFNDASFYRPNGSTFVWSGTDYQFFWTNNYAGALWATNNVPGFQSNPTSTIAASGDGIRWFDQDESGWVNFLPQVDGSNFLQGSLLIFPYKNRLVMLNTTEGPNFATQTYYRQRARWCQNGTPYYTAPTPTNYAGGTTANAWRSDLVGFGGFIDAPTLEQIVAAQFLKDTLIVFFERSTWNLRYTGNELLPFIWEKINTELGATSTFSEVPFDEVVLGVGDVGIHACDTVSVERIDQRIPDEVFAIQAENQGKQRVYGTRDYFNQLVYWTIPYSGSDDQEGNNDGGQLPPPGIALQYPNVILVYNYIDKSFSFFNDSFTCFGYYQKAADTLWQDITTEWQATQFNWVSPLSLQQFPFVVAGNQLGFVEIFAADQVVNDNSLFISQITPGNPFTSLTIPNHNLTVGDFIKITAASGITGLIGNIYRIFAVTDSNTVFIGTTPTGTFTGNGTALVISNINIVTKRFNPFIEQAVQVRLGRVDLYFDATVNGQVTVNLYIDEDTTIPINATYNTVNTFPETTYQLDDDTVPFANSKLWKRVQFHDVSQLFQLQITMSDNQLVVDNIVESDIVLHGMILYFAPGGRLLNV